MAGREGDIRDAFQELLVAQVYPICGKLDKLHPYMCKHILFEQLHLTDDREMQLKLLASPPLSQIL